MRMARENERRKRRRINRSVRGHTKRSERTATQKMAWCVSPPQHTTPTPRKVTNHRVEVNTV